MKNKKTSDFNSPSRPGTIMLRERTWRIELSRSKIKRFLRQHKIIVTATVAVFLMGVVTRYVLIGFASTVDFYPSSCLGNWENVQNALGKPDITAGSSPSAFTTINSALFGTSTAQMFCGNFSGDTDISALTDKSFQEADLVLSWSVVFPQNAVAPDSSAVLDDASTTTSTTTIDNVATGMTDTIIAATTTDATTTSDVSPDIVSSTISAPADNTAASPDTSAPDSTPTPASAPAPDPVPAPASDPTPAPDTSASPTSWLRNLVGIAYADGTSTDTAQPSSSITINTSIFQNIILPSSTANDILAIVYSTDGVTWQPLADIDSSNWQTGRYPIPIHSWTELQHLQVAFIGAGESSSPQIFLDAAGVEVSYVDPPEATTEIAPLTDASSTATSTASTTLSDGTSAEAVTSPAQTSAEALQEVFDPTASQSCSVSPFSAIVHSPGSAAFVLKLVPPPASGTAPTAPFLFDASIGSLPAGVTGDIIPGVNGADTMGVNVSASAMPGSYTVVVVYKERQPSGNILPNFCQFNLIINN